ncbi:hypothetical protein [Mesomycoplasma ovipneumoniae]|uniref:hypothetical protein n=1 Tax=Mesomycoplasma ovipneumoniae TaxID=29562 RepID=UPI00311A5D70
MDGVFKIGADFVSKTPTKIFHNEEGFKTTAKEGFQTTYNGEIIVAIDKRMNTGIAIQPKNPHSDFQDFLNNSESTIILRVDVEKKDDKSVMNMKFYSTESDDAKKPIFIWSRDIPTNAKMNFEKGFTFGTTKSKLQEEIDKLPFSRSETGVTFKGFVLFDTPQTEEEYNKLFEKFRSEYV